MTITSLPKRLGHLLNNKLLAIIATLAVVVGVGVAQNQTKADYAFGTAYQYFLLSNQDALKGAKDSTAPVIGGALGSGGVSGSFGYDDLVNSASKHDKNSARQFATMMSTYTTFGYISSRTQGFDAILPAFGRLLSILLVIFALPEDLMQVIVVPFISIVAKYNPINLLGSAFVHTDLADSIAGALKISPDQIKTVINVFMSFAITMIIISLGMALRNGSANVDRNAMSKLKGRVFTLVALPLVLSASALILQSVTTLPLISDLGSNDTFPKYFIDVNNWAYKNNFSPTGANNSDSGSFTAKSGYVDTQYNPYSDTGQKRVQQINNDSPMYNGLFKNTVYILDYAGSGMFTARDWLSFKGSDRSVGTFGSYYNYATQHPYLLGDVTKSYNPSMSTRSGSAKDTNYGKAVTDEFDKDGKPGEDPVESPIQAWQDRFIWGSKNAGDKLKDYYTTAPSLEQIAGMVGSGSNDGSTYSLADQTMFLVLSSTFNESGGRYLIDAPARGLLATKAQFDSNRSDYYNVSMVGNPLFTIMALMGESIIRTVVFIALIMVIIEIGLLDMALRPLKAFGKGITLGDIEYPLSFLILSFGVAGTYFVMMVMPSLMILFFDGASGIISKAITTTQPTDTMTPAESLSIYGTNKLAGFILAITVLLLFWKNEKFRNNLKSALAFIWEWCVAKSEALERQANGGMSSRVKAIRNRNVKAGQERLKTGQEMLATAGGSKLGQSAISAYKNLIGKGEEPDPNDPQNPNGKNIPTGVLPTVPDTTADFNKDNAGKFDKAKRNLANFALKNPNASRSVVDSADDAKKAIAEYENNPTAENKRNALDAVETLQNRIKADEHKTGFQYEKDSKAGLEDTRNDVLSTQPPRDISDKKPEVSKPDTQQTDATTQGSNEKPADVNQKVTRETEKSSDTDVIPDAKQGITRTPKTGADDDKLVDASQDVIRKGSDVAGEITDANQDVSRKGGDVTGEITDASQGITRKGGSVVGDVAGTSQDVIRKGGSVVGDLASASQDVIRKGSDVAGDVVDAKQNVNRQAVDTGISAVAGATQAVTRHTDKLADDVQATTQNVNRRVQDSGSTPVTDTTQNVNRRVQDSGSTPVTDTTQNVNRRVQDSGSTPLADTTQNVNRRVQDSGSTPLADTTQNVNRRVRSSDTSAVENATQNISRHVSPARVTSELTSAIGTQGRTPEVRDAVRNVSNASSTKELTKAMKALRVTLAEKNISGDDTKIHDVLKSRFETLKSSDK